jgi:hypothetical protein
LSEDVFIVFYSLNFYPMIHKTTALFLATLCLFLSCNKIDVKRNPLTTDNSKSLLQKKANTLSGVCGHVDMPNVDTFATQNKVPDATINPVTGGTAIANAENNYQRIQWCLAKYGHAYLGSGSFTLNHMLVLTNDTLISANGDWPVVEAISNPDGRNSFIAMNGNSRVAFLSLNANKFFMDQPNASIVEMLDDLNQVDNCFVMGASTPLLKTDNGELVGVYILCGDNNMVWNNKISNCDHGVIANSYIATAVNNVIKGNALFYNRRDGVSLPGYGQVIGNRIYLNGWDCRNGGGGTNPPIPGAGIYVENNLNGALIQYDTIYDNNGHNIDIVNVNNFSILNNYVYNPGNPSFPATDYMIAPDFGAAFSVSLFNISNSTIEGNDIRNEGRPSNAVGMGGVWGGDKNHVMSEDSAGVMSDLPFGDSSIIAFCLGELRPRAPFSNQTGNNVIRNNIFIASPNGIGYFSTRNTGFAADLSWSSQTTNYFTLNNPFGSNIGSVRAGGNWYAANGVDPNTDDYQHQPPGSSWSGSDNKNFYNPAQ